MMWCGGRETVSEGVTALDGSWTVWLDSAHRTTITISDGRWILFGREYKLEPTNPLSFRWPGDEATKQTLQSADGPRLTWVTSHLRHPIIVWQRMGEGATSMTRSTSEEGPRYATPRLRVPQAGGEVLKQVARPFEPDLCCDRRRGVQQHEKEEGNQGYPGRGAPPDDPPAGVPRRGHLMPDLPPKEGRINYNK